MTAHAPDTQVSSFIFPHVANWVGVWSVSCPHAGLKPKKRVSTWSGGEQRGSGRDESVPETFDEADIESTGTVRYVALGLHSVYKDIKAELRCS